MNWLQQNYQSIAALGVLLTIAVTLWGVFVRLREHAEIRIQTYRFALPPAFQSFPDLISDINKKFELIRFEGIEWYWKVIIKNKTQETLEGCCLSLQWTPKYASLKKHGKSESLNINSDGAGPCGLQFDDIMPGEAIYLDIWLDRPAIINRSNVKDNIKLITKRVFPIRYVTFLDSDALFYHIYYVRTTTFVIIALGVILLLAGPAGWWLAKYF